MSESEKNAPGREVPLPPASFDYLIFSLRAQAELHLGLIATGSDTENPEPDLPAARHYIDLLGMLTEKTRGNLTLEEQRFLENSLTELRFRYVQAADEARNRPAGEAEGQPA